MEESTNCKADVGKDGAVLRQDEITCVSNQLTMPKKDERLALPALGEFYDDLLVIDAWLNGSSKVNQGKILLSAQLQEREPKIRDCVTYLAKKRNISPDEMWLQILSGKAQKITADELSEIIEDEQEETTDD
jgi:hypothetical protein